MQSAVTIEGLATDWWSLKGLEEVEQKLRIEITFKLATEEGLRLAW